MYSQPDSGDKSHHSFRGEDRSNLQQGRRLEERVSILQRNVSNIQNKIPVIEELKENFEKLNTVTLQQIRDYIINSRTQFQHYVRNEQRIKQQIKWTKIELERQFADKLNKSRRELFEKIDWVKGRTCTIGHEIVFDKRQFGNRIVQIVEEIKKTQEEMGRLKDRMIELVETSEQIAHYSDPAIDMTLTEIKYFTIEGNKIIHNGENNELHSIAINRTLEKNKPFKLHVLVNSTQNGFISLGIVDKLTHKKQKHVRSSTAILYCGDGWIHKDPENQYDEKETDIYFSTGSEIFMKVELDRNTVTFLVNNNGRRSQFRVCSLVLSQKYRQFVPVFEMCDKGDSITWRIQ